MKKIILFLPIILFSSSFYYYSGEKKIFLSPIGTTKKMQGIEVFKTTDGKEIKIDNKILVKLKYAQDLKVVQESFKLEFLEKLTDTLVVFKARSSKEAINISAKIKEQNWCDFAQPNFYTEIKKR